MFESTGTTCLRVTKPGEIKVPTSGKVSHEISEILLLWRDGGTNAKGLRANRCAVSYLLECCFPLNRDSRYLAVSRIPKNPARRTRHNAVSEFQWFGVSYLARR